MSDLFMKIRYLLPALLWAMVIFWVISLPPSSIPRTPLLRIPHFDKLVHFSIFAFLGLFLSYGFFKQLGTFTNRNLYTFSLIIGVIYGGATELYQFHYVEGRSGEILDFVANVAGCISGLLTFYLVQIRFPGFIK